MGEGAHVALSVPEALALCLPHRDDGLQHCAAWAEVSDGVLFFDAKNDGLITESREYVFTEWDPTAKDDMGALRARFDTNDDGVLNSADADFAKFKVMVTNADGSQTAMTLAHLGITQINLKTDATEIRFEVGSVITGQSRFVKNGVVQTAGAVTLVSEADKMNIRKLRLLPLIFLSRNFTAMSNNYCHFLTDANPILVNC